MLKVRKWSNVSNTPWDVIYQNGDKTHYQPGAVFSTEAQAQKHLEDLQQTLEINLGAERFINDNWPTD